MRVLVTGSRNWRDRHTIREALVEATKGVPAHDVIVVHGACPTGADAIADMEARLLGFGVERHPADWKTEGKAAGFRRNLLMVRLGADVCLGFALPCVSNRCRKPRPHNSHGTDHCASAADSAGIPTTVYLDSP